MVAYTRQRLTLRPLLPLLGAAAAVVLAGLAPIGLVERLVGWSGVASHVPPMAPPLGDTARILLCIAAGLSAGAALWLAGGITERRKPRALTFDPIETPPSIRRADAHPDAPPRPPVIASRELGPPLMAVEIDEVDEVDDCFGGSGIVGEVDEVDGCFASLDVERPLPADLDTPLAAYRPDILATVAPGEAPPMPIARPATFDPGERFETFELTPPAPARRAAPFAEHPPITTVATEASIHALLDRLEAGVARRGIPRAANSDAVRERLRRGAAGG